MIFTRLVSPLALVATILTSSAVGQRVSGIPTSLAGLSLCAQADVVVLGVNVVSGLCVCAVDAVLTPSYVDALNARAKATSGLLAGIVGLTDAALNALITTGTTLNPVLGRAPIGNCVIPANSVADSCDSCAFTCANGYVLCGSNCIPTGDACTSTNMMSGRKRDIRNIPKSLRCPRKQTACLIPNSGIFTGRNYECIDTTNNIESCGGCEIPLPGERAGQDCTAIPYVDSVSCVIDKCVISSCQKGYEPSGTECVKSVDILADSLAFVEAAFKGVDQPTRRSRSQNARKLAQGSNPRR